MLRAALAEERGRTVRHDPDLLRRAGLQLDQETACGLGHHDHAFGLAAQRKEHVELMRRRLREQRVQGHDERCEELSRERQDVLPFRATVDPVLVLEQDDVDVEAAKQPAART